MDSRQLDRIESRLESLDSKLDNHLERIAKAETSVMFLKRLIFLVIGILSTTAMAAVRIVLEK